MVIHQADETKHHHPFRWEACLTVSLFFWYLVSDVV